MGEYQSGRPTGSSTGLKYIGFADLEEKDSGIGVLSKRTFAQHLNSRLFLEEMRN
jgi:hypothetical protein